MGVKKKGGARGSYNLVGDDVVVRLVGLALLVVGPGNLPEHTALVEGPEGNALGESLVVGGGILEKPEGGVGLDSDNARRQGENEKGNELVGEEVKGARNSDAGVVTSLQSAHESSALSKSLGG